MSERSRLPFIFPPNQLSNGSAIKSFFKPIRYLGISPSMIGMTIPVLIGCMVGSILLIAIVSHSQWAILTLLIVLASPILFLVKDLRKLLFITLVVDIPLGLDIGLGNRLEHNGGSSGFIFSLMTFALIIGYLVWLARKPDSRDPKYIFHWDVSIPALIYMFAMLLSAFQATKVWFSLTQLFLELQFLLMYFFLIHQVKSWTEVRLILTVLVICLLVESLIILLQYFTGFEFSIFGIQTGGLGSGIDRETARLGGTLGHPNTAATFLTASLLLTFGGFLTRNRFVNRKLALVALSLGTVALMTTQSRIAWISFAALMPLLALYGLKKRVNADAILLVSLVALTVGFVFFGQIIQRFTADDGGSAESRIWQTKLAFNILSDHALTGVGLNNLWEVVPQYLPIEMVGNENVIHDKYLTVWTETGLLGLISFLWLFIAAVSRILRVLKNPKDAYISIVISSLLAALLAFMLQMSVATFNERSRLQLIWLVLALIVLTTEIAKATDA